MHDVDVVIISWARHDGLLAETKKGLQTLFTSEKAVRFHAYVVESNLTVSYDDLATGEHTCKTLYPKGLEFGYHRYLNIGIREGKSPYVVLCNSDLTYAPGWASKIIALMEAEPRILSASPSCPLIHGKKADAPYHEGYGIRKELAGWCIFQQRKIYEQLGQLDERFKFWYCDNDYAKELETRKIPHVRVTDSLVTHHTGIHGHTADSLDRKTYKEYTYDQQYVFERKWSKGR